MGCTELEENIPKKIGSCRLDTDQTSWFCFLIRAIIQQLLAKPPNPDPFKFRAGV